MMDSFPGICCFVPGTALLKPDNNPTAKREHHAWMIFRYVLHVIAARTPLLPSDVPV